MPDLSGLFISLHAAVCSLTISKKLHNLAIVSIAALQQDGAAFKPNQGAFIYGAGFQKMKEESIQLGNFWRHWTLFRDMTVSGTEYKCIYYFLKIFLERILLTF